VEIFGNWKITEAKIDWRKRGETMVKRGENVVAPGVLPRELRPIADVLWIQTDPLPAHNIVVPPHNLSGVFF
jgi:hypothetical protein